MSLMCTCMYSIFCMIFSYMKYLHISFLFWSPYSLLCSMFIVCLLINQSTQSQVSTDCFLFHPILHSADTFLIVFFGLYKIRMISIALVNRCLLQTYLLTYWCAFWPVSLLLHAPGSMASA